MLLHHHHQREINHTEAREHNIRNLLGFSVKRKKKNSLELETINSDSSHDIIIAKSDPFSINGSLTREYGHIGEALGSGAGGSVHILQRNDNNVFAVKEFKKKGYLEKMSDYKKKCTLEYEIGNICDHPNIIKIYAITSYNDRYYQVMEYCPIDFFGVVASGRMSRNEVDCCFRQMCEGVRYLHSKGFAHRDLKLENCVVTKLGILKWVDFGSAVPIRGHEGNRTKASGARGSEPYMAPEVFSSKKYDPALADVWSLAIIYFAMLFNKFPWTAPKSDVKPFMLYCMPDEQPHDYSQLTASSTYSEIEFEDSKMIHLGPHRVIRLLPPASRLIISKMLKVDPRERAQISDIFSDEWFDEIKYCTEKGGRVLSCSNHTHTYIPAKAKLSNL